MLHSQLYLHYQSLARPQNSPPIFGKLVTKNSPIGFIPWPLHLSVACLHTLSYQITTDQMTGRD